MSASFRYVQPHGLEDACRFLAGHAEDARALAGGTDLLVGLRRGTISARYLVGLGNLREPGDIDPLTGGGMRIGFRATLEETAAHPLIGNRYRALSEAAHTVGSVQIRNRGTVVGNICNASPAADTAPALLVFEAAVNIRGAEGRRTVPLEEFFLGPARTALGPGELVESIDLPPAGSPSASCYLKLGRTRGVDLAVVGVSVCMAADGETRVALASVAPTPMRARAAEEILASGTGSGALEDAARAAADEISPVSDVRASAAYRRAMARVLFKRAVLLARKRQEGRA